MDVKLVSLADQNKIEALIQALHEVESKKLSDLLNVRAVDGRGDPIPLLRAIFRGSPCESSEGLKRRIFIYKHASNLLNDGGMSSKVTTEMIGVLLVELDGFPGRQLAELADMFIETIKSRSINSGKSLELFPKILSAISAKEVIPLHIDGGGEMTGPEYKSQLLNSLCANRWDSKCVVHLANMFRDVPMTSEELRFVIEKLIRMLKDLELEELPPLVYQLLLLSTKGHKRLVIEGIITYFNHLDETRKAEQDKQDSDDVVEGISKDQLKHMEGTVILHVTFAIKQDQDLGREFIKYLKAGNIGTVLSSFTVALALSVARIHRFEETIYDYLKAAISKSFKDAERRKNSKWIHDTTPDSPEIDEMLLETVQNSLFGWDHVTQGLVQLGMNLMDAFGSRTISEHYSGSSVLSSSQQSCQLGSKILLNTFKAHEMVRTDILEQILSRVVTKATTPVNHFIDLLASTVSSAPQILLDSLPRVREAFDYLSYLPPQTAEGLLKSVQPLMKISPTLKDSLILILRKAMFSRNVDARKIAVSGFLLILKHFKILGGGFSSSQASQSASQSFSCSQVLVDIHHPGNTNVGNEGLCLEILGNLRRCLTQQADVRMGLYEGLYDVLRKNKQLQQPILDMIYTQFQRYYETGDDVHPPVKLEPCLSYAGDEVYLSEPLAHLLSSLLHCVIKAAENLDSQENVEDEALSSVVNNVEETFQSLVQRMGKSELEDFELDKSADFSLTTGVGIKNNIYAKLVLGLYEVLIEFTFTAGDFSVESCEEILHLYANHYKLSEILKEKANAAGKKSKVSASKIPSKSMISFGCVVSLTKVLLSDTVPNHQEGLTLLRENMDFVRYLVNSTVQKLTQIMETGACDGPYGNNSDHIIKQCCILGRVLLKQITGDSCLTVDVRKDKGKRVTSVCVEGFCTLVNIMCCKYSNKLSHFLTSIDQSRESDASSVAIDDEERVSINIKRFQRLLMTITASNNEDLSLREAHSIISVITRLSNHLNPDGQQFAELQDWVQKLCADQSIDDIAVNKSLVMLLITLTSQCKITSSLAKELAQDIHTHTGDVDEDVEMDEDKTHYAVVNQKTAAPTVLILLLSHMDKVLDEVDYMITITKGQLAALTVKSVDDKIGSPGNTQQSSLETSCCSRLIGLVYAYHEIIQSAMPTGPCAENTIKSLIKLYNVLGTLTKYYLLLYTQKLGHVTGKFEKLTRLTGTHLAQQIYALMTYIQSAQSQSLQEQSQIAKNKAKKKTNKGTEITGKSKVMKEIRSFPNLVYAMEQFERYLIQLSKKSKINFMEHFKRSTSRDFRINGATLEAALREAESEEEDEEGEESGTEDEPAAKKAKTIDEQTKKNKLSRKNKKALKDSN